MFITQFPTSQVEGLRAGIEMSETERFRLCEAITALQHERAALKVRNICMNALIFIYVYEAVCMLRIICICLI